MPALVGLVHSMVAIKGIVINFATYLACSVRGLVGAHSRVALFVENASIEFFERGRLIGGWIATIASWEVTIVVPDRKVLAAWINASFGLRIV